jgi:hypothetical protein
MLPLSPDEVLSSLLLESAHPAIASAPATRSPVNRARLLTVILMLLLDQWRVIPRSG